MLNSRYSRVLFILFTSTAIVAGSRHSVPAFSQEAQWPRFRGFDATGVSENSGLPDRWSETENVDWKSELPGRGWGAPVVWGNMVFLTSVVNCGNTEPLRKGL